MAAGSATAAGTACACGIGSEGAADSTPQMFELQPTLCGYPFTIRLTQHAWSRPPQVYL